MKKILTSFLIFLLPVLAFAQFGSQKVISVHAVASQDKVISGQEFDIAVIIDIESGLHINSHTPNSEFYIPTLLKFTPIQNFEFQSPVFPKAEMKTFVFSDEKIAVYEGQIKVITHVKTNTESGPGVITITGQVSYQGCNDNVCFAPGEENFELKIELVEPGSIVTLVNQEYFGDTHKETLPDNEQELTRDEQKARQILEKGMLYAVIAFFGIGLALNLTPCVYPVIPLTVSYFGGQSGKSRGASFVNALFYQFGIAFAFAILGLVSSLAGKQWGFLFTSPWFVVVIAVIILSMAASLFGAFEITVPSWLLTSVGKNREGLIGSLIMGLTVGIVIAPCAAGIIIGLLGLIAKMGLVVKGTILFFAMGMGLGLPYLILATFSGLLQKLPQSGMWMIWVRKFFAILLIGVALYFIIPQLERVNDKFGFMAGLLGIFGGLLLGFLDHTPGYTRMFKIVRGIFGIALIVLGFLWTQNAIHSKASEINWLHSENIIIDDYIGKGKPVFMDFYADWCAPCKQMDNVTFRNPQVVEMADSFNMIKIDCTAPDESTKILMERFNVTGMPTFIFISPTGNIMDELRETGFVEPDDFVVKMETAVK